MPFGLYNFSVLGRVALGRFKHPSPCAVPPRASLLIILGLDLLGGQWLTSGSVVEQNLY